MKVLFLIDTLETGGAEQSTLEICKNFRRVQPVVCHIYPGDRMKHVFEAAGVRVISLNIDGKYSFLKAIKAVAQIVREERPDLIHTTLFRAGIVARWIAASKKLPVVDSFVNDSYAEIRLKSLSRRDRLKLRIAQTIDMVTAPWIFRFLALTETVRTSNCGALRVPLNKVYVIPRGRDPRFFEKKHPPDSDLDLDASGPVLLNVARLISRKGQLELIRAMPAVRESFPKVRLLIAGEGPHRAILEECIQSERLAGHVKLLGERRDISALLDRADIFVFPSHYEGHGGALVEAMFAAKAIIASDTEVNRESIQHQVSGLLVSPGDAKGIEEAIYWILSHGPEAKRMGMRAREIAIERFSIDKIVQKTEDFYEDTLRAWLTKK